MTAPAPRTPAVDVVADEVLRPGEVRRFDIDGERVPLESCVCGSCYDCPDGWHSGDDLPCSCTADCALAAEEEE